MKTFRYGNAFAASLRVFLFWSIFFGFVYTLAMTGLAQLLFPRQANGSLLKTQDGRQMCPLLGQQFSREDLFHGRVTIPNLTTYFDGPQLLEGDVPLYYGGPSNKSPATEEFASTIRERVALQHKMNPEAKSPVPVDLITNSGSGTDPHISLAAAEWQIPRVAKATGKTPETLREILRQCTDGRFLGIWGQPRVNVLKANLLLLGALPLDNVEK